MTATDKIATIVLLAGLGLVVVMMLRQEAKLDRWRETLEQPVVDDEYLERIDLAVTAAYDELAARRNTRPSGNVVRLFDRDGAA